MPTFIFNKLIRDNLIAEYVKMGQVATYRALSGNELLDALKHKIIEEANEIPLTGSKDDITSELADIQQVIDVIAQCTHITSDEISEAKQRKFAKKGGFSAGLYVEKLELTDDDVWVEYYRNSPEKYKEIT
jgi:predicted house-cleaning noncanonical NTP pyrophosphatase (MazG superfamily)